MASRLLATVLLLTVAVAAGLFTRGPATRAESVLARALGPAAAAVTTVGEFTWLEEAGIGIKLPAAPASDGWPRLLAGEARGPAAALWELGPQGFAALQQRLEESGGRVAGSSDFTFMPRSGLREVRGRSVSVALKDGRAVAVHWQAEGRAFALVVSGGADTELLQRRDELLRESAVLPAVPVQGVAPLLFEGAYAFTLRDARRDGMRFVRETPQGRLALRMFQIKPGSFASLGDLQTDLEKRLERAGLRRSGGTRPTVAGQEGFAGEYFGDDGTVQRILYAQLDSGYLVALFHGPDALRETLTQTADAFAQSVTPLHLASRQEGPQAHFGLVRAVRCLAWQDGERVLWGALFDDSRQQPVLWRQSGVRWEVQLTRGGQVIEHGAGEASSSRDLNPLVNASTRGLAIPAGVQGPVEVVLDVGGQRTRTSLTLR
ncbi:MAG: hypothetical protein IT463_07835 [Planctomycetes bacterium]|nr:hypothetical protein [Planctomycetota bacterium]